MQYELLKIAAELYSKAGCACGTDMQALRALGKRIESVAERVEGSNQVTTVMDDKIDQLINMIREHRSKQHWVNAAGVANELVAHCLTLFHEALARKPETRRSAWERLMSAERQYREAVERDK